MVLKPKGLMKPYKVSNSEGQEVELSPRWFSDNAWKGSRPAETNSSQPRDRNRSVRCIIFSGAQLGKFERGGRRYIFNRKDKIMHT